MKSFIMFRCGHSYHKVCILQKVKEDRLESGADTENIQNEEDTYEELQPFLVEPQYIPLPIFDKKRERRMQHLAKKIKETVVQESLIDKDLNRCTICSETEVL